MVRSSVPSGASTGEFEAVELRDGSGPFHGKGVTTALQNIQNILKPKLIGKDCTEQKEIDNVMLEIDGTDNKRELGANAILGISMAVARAGALSLDLPLFKYLGNLKDLKGEKLPIPVMNIINGGMHAGNNLDFQEYMIVPSGAKSFSEAIRLFRNSLTEDQLKYYDYLCQQKATMDETRFWNAVEKENYFLNHTLAERQRIFYRWFREWLRKSQKGLIHSDET